MSEPTDFTPLSIIFFILTQENELRLEKINDFALEDQIKCLQPHNENSQTEVMQQLRVKKIIENPAEIHRVEKVLSNFYKWCQEIQKPCQKMLGKWTDIDFCVNIIVYCLQSHSNEIDKANGNLEQLEKELKNATKIWKFLYYLCKYFIEKKYNINMLLEQNNSSNDSKKKGFGLIIVKQVCKAFNQKSGQFVKTKSVLSDWARQLLERHETEKNSNNNLNDNQLPNNNEDQSNNQPEKPIVNNFMNPLNENDNNINLNETTNDDNNNNNININNNDDQNNNNNDNSNGNFLAPVFHNNQNNEDQNQNSNHTSYQNIDPQPYQNQNENQNQYPLSINQNQNQNNSNNMVQNHDNNDNHGNNNNNNNNLMNMNMNMNMNNLNVNEMNANLQNMMQQFQNLMKNVYQHGNNPNYFCNNNNNNNNNVFPISKDMQWFWFCDDDKSNIQWIPYNSHYQYLLNQGWFNNWKFVEVGDYRIKFKRDGPGNRPIGEQYNIELNKTRRDVICDKPDNNGCIHGILCAKYPKK